MASGRDEQWYSGQLKFLEEHKYFTEAARALQNPQKDQNMQELRELLKALPAGDKIQQMLVGRVI